MKKNYKFFLIAVVVLVLAVIAVAMPPPPSATTSGPTTIKWTPATAGTQDQNVLEAVGMTSTYEEFTALTFVAAQTPLNANFYYVTGRAAPDLNEYTGQPAIFPFNEVTPSPEVVRLWRIVSANDARRWLPSVR